MATFTARKRKSHIKYEGASFERYPHRLLLYKDPPIEEISLETFEQFAIDRLKLLREVENINIRFKKGTEDHDRKMRAALKEFVPVDFEPKDIGEKSMVNGRVEVKIEKRTTNETEDLMKKMLVDRRKDHISHFILRLAFSRSEDLRRWFLMQEMDLFRYRFHTERPEEIDLFLKGNKIHFTAISDEEKTPELLSKLTDSMFMGQLDVVKATSFYKVPFTDVLDLVRNRKVYLHRGLAYVPHQELVSIIISIYRSKLSHALTVMSRKLPYLEEDSRLLPILKNLSTAYIGDAYTAKKAAAGDKLTLKEIDEVSKTSFPLCSRNMHEGLRKDNHLKHFARLQYGLFLKGCGLSLEEALLFWRMEFTKKMEVDKFEKQYAYNIRHSFGKEGKRSDYTPYSCMKIITTNQPGPGDHHGCPFKHSDVENLTRRLQSYKISREDINEVVELVKGQHYQIACGKYFEITHKLPENSNVLINHPNQYFDESRVVLKKGASHFQPRVKQEVKQEPMDTSTNQNTSLNTSTNHNASNIIEDDFDMGEEMQIEI